MYKHYAITEELMKKAIINNPKISHSEYIKANIKPMTEEEYVRFFKTMRCIKMNCLTCGEV